MENFNWTSFMLRIAIKAPIQQLYNAWAQPSAITKWFLETAVNTSVDGNPIDPSLPANAGDTYQWTWFVYDEVEKGQFLEANGVNNLKFSFAGPCVVEIALREEYEYTVVMLTQSNIPTDDASKKNIRLGCHNGWSFYLVNLKSVYEGGIDLRNKDTRFPPMLNN